MADSKVRVILSAVDQTAKAFLSAQKNLDSLKKTALSANKILGGLGVVLSVGAVAAFAKNTIDAADSLNDLSDRTGVAVKDLASLALAAKLSDTSLMDVGKAIQRLNLSVGQAAGGSDEIAKSLTDLGVSSTDARERLFQIADAYKASGGQGKILADIQKVLGKSYTELIPLLKQGGDALRKQAQASESFAESVARLAPEAAKFNDQLDELKQAAAGASARGVYPLVLSLNETIKRVRELNAEGPTALALLRGFAGLGKIPLDLFFPSEQVATTATGRLAELRAELAKLERDRAKALDRNGFLGTTFNPAKVDAEIAQLKKLIALQEQFGAKVIKPPAAPGVDINAQITCAADGGIWDGKKCVKKKTPGSKPTDPLASIISQTDTAKLAEYEKLLNLLSARFDDGRKNAVQFQEALAILNKQFGFEQIDIFGSFKTTDKAVADFIKEQQDAVNEFNREMAEDGVAAAEAYKSALDGLLADTTLVKTANLYENIDLLNQAFFDGVIGVQQYEEAVANITGKTDEAVKQTKSLAEELGLTFSSAFEDAIVGGESFRDILKGIEADILRIITRKLITEPLGSALTGFLGGLVPSANGNVFNSPALSSYSGSVVSKPTVFTFASGIGLMGEAGAEAILPLKRGRNGKLGVESQGGGGTVVHMHINTPDANSFRKSTGQITAQVSGALSRARRNM